MQDALFDLKRFVHDKDERMPILVKIGLIHAQFETIHPFLDGNGRLGRMLITFLLCHKEVLQYPVLYISHFFKRHREQYYDLLQGTRDRGDWESWISFFLNAVATVANEASETARQIVALRESTRSTIVRDFGRAAGNGLEVLETLFTQPIVDVNTIAEQRGLSYAAANDLVRRFVDSGILNEVTGQRRNRLFRFDGYINAFSD